MQKTSKLVNMTGKKKAIIIISSIGGTLAILAGSFFIYTGIYYHTDKEKVDAYLAQKNVDINKEGNSISIKGKNASDVGIIFYPGAKVEYTAYEPLMASIAEQGYNCFLLHMPFNLAIFNKNAADGYIKEHQDIKHWYLMGHSLGGVVASQYIDSHLDDYDGLIMLGSYPDRDLSQSSLSYLSIHGSEDKVMNIDKYEASKPKRPSNHHEFVISGGCHAGFGMYGAQKGDGTPSITSEEQIDITTSIIVETLSL